MWRTELRAAAYWLVAVLPFGDVLTVTVLLALLARPYFASENLATAVVLLLIAPLVHFCLGRAGVYESHRLRHPRDIVRKVLGAHAAAAAVALSLCLVFADAAVTRAVGLVLIGSFLILGGVKLTVAELLRILRRHGFDQRRVLFVGNWSQAEGVAEQMRRNPEWGLALDCVATGELTNRGFYGFADGERLGADLEEFLKRRVVDEVLIPVGSTSVRTAFEEARLFEQYGLLVRLVFDPVSAPVQPRVEEFIGSASLSVAPSVRTEQELAMKRSFDVVIGGLLMVAAAPVLVGIALVIKMTSPGPILFTQTRVGLNGRKFRFYKFRTMINGAEFMVRQANRSITNGPIFKDPRDYRVTLVGRFLRKFSLDELPQLWNVIRGDMSLVGPRPLPVDEAEQINGRYRRRFSVPPGLTCTWQVSGRSDVSYDTWMNYDLQYVDRWSLWTDTVLLLRTIPAVLSGRGSY